MVCWMPRSEESHLQALELGPCNVTQNLTTQVNPYSWSEVSNLLFLSQPLGVGFSYGSEGVGSLNPSMLFTRGFNWLSILAAFGH